MKILSVVGTRPNFIKISSLVKEIKNNNIQHTLVHTGQHYDREMSKLFFDDLKLQKPDFNLGVGSGTYGQQIGRIIMDIEPIMIREQPDIVIVVGDVNSTFVGALVAKQLGFKVAHVEAGLRSFDMSMPEEINRILTDRISDFLFTTEESANSNLLNEGIPKDKIHFVGNVMIDTLLEHKKKSHNSKILEKLKITKKDYCTATIHRPSNVDNKKSFEKIISIINKIQKNFKVVFPIHPRTQKNLEIFGLEKTMGNMKNLVVTEPLGYLDFISLMDNSKFVVTDSGGIQEETTMLGVPCVTLRKNTERPVTLNEGTNMLVSTDQNKIITICKAIIQDRKVKGKIPKFWDGKSSKRIIKILLKELHNKPNAL